MNYGIFRGPDELPVNEIADGTIVIVASWPINPCVEGQAMMIHGTRLVCIGLGKGMSYPTALQNSGNVTAFPGGTKAVARQIPGIAALQEGRVHELDPSLLMRAGPRVPVALEAVAAAIHPVESPK